MKRILFGVVAAFALLVGLAWIAASSSSKSGAPRPASIAAPGPADGTSVPIQDLGTANTDAVRLEPDSIGASSIVYRVQDAMASAVEGAILSWEPGVPGLRSVSTLMRLGESSSQGEIELRLPLVSSDEAAGERILVMRHPRFVSKVLEIPREPGSVDVTLDAASSLGVRVRKTDLSPAPGAVVVVSRSAMMASELQEGGLGVCDPRSGFAFAGQANGEGLVSIDGIPGGEYFVSAFLGGHVVLCADQPNGVVSLSGGVRSELLFVASPIYAAVAVVRGDDLFQVSLEQTVAGEESSALVGIHLDRCRQDLQAKFPGAIVLTVSEREAQERGLVLSINALLRKAGERTLDVSLREVSRIVDPLDVHVDPEGGKPLAIARLTLRIVDSRGMDLSGIGVRLLSSDNSSVFASATSGKEVEVLGGRYGRAIVVAQPWIQHRMSLAAFELSDKETAEVTAQIAEPAARLPISVMRKDGGVLAFARVAIRCENGYRCDFGVASKQAAIWLPIGRVTGTVTCRGCISQEFSVSLGTDGEVEPLKVVLVPE